MSNVIEITSTFESNFKRLDNLIVLYESIRASNQGRTSVSQIELLRATVVLAHSTLEDFLRAIQILKLPNTDSVMLNEVWLDQTRMAKFSMKDIFNHRNITVQKLIEDSVKNYLNHQGYNSTNDICQVINSCDLEVTEDIRNLFTSINELMLRRHHIIHRADKNENRGRGHHKYKSLNLSKVREWISSIDSLTSLLTLQL